MFSRIKVNFQKYLTVIAMSWSNGFAYPLSFWMWRVRQMMSMVIAISLWESIFRSTPQVFGYYGSQMLTYIFVSNVVGFITLSSRTIEVPNVIRSGDLSLYLIRPLRFFVYWFSRDIADKFQNVIFATFELIALYFIFHPTLIAPTHLATLLVAALAVFGGLTMYYFINMIFGFLAFWSPDVWAPRFLFFVIMFFVSGSTFPLDIYPPAVVKILSFSPFPYLVFFPSKIWLEQVSSAQILYGFIAMISWIIGLALFALLLWKQGVRGYSSDGR